MEDNINRSKQLQDRLLDFTAATIGWASTQQIPRSVADQITRSSSSIGANYTEAINASSKADFRNKIYISKKEAAETDYWIKLIVRMRPEARNDALQQECHHILMIFQKTVNTINEKGQSSKVKEGSKINGQ